MTIYVVDDHPLMRDAIASVLRRLKPDMPIVEVGTLADLQAKANADARPGLIFLDLNLPDARGCSAVHQVKQNFPMVPLAIYSASPAADMKKECTDAGADIYIEKTANLQELGRALHSLLSRTQHSHAWMMTSSFTPLDSDLVR
ncbi:response regulator [Variovorax sp. RB2P76]|uniref:response regulator n=1 Tax=Variovorax sp. RB2P76 TaxID=3443736 RepID=UPI003F454ADF